MLTLHRIVERCQADHDITWSSFRALLDGIAAGGTRVDARLGSEDCLRGRAVALTFDDGTADHLRAGEELAGRGIPGLFFVPAGRMGRPGHLGAPQLRALSALGHGVGSHGWSHLPLDEEMPPEVVTRELRDSKRLLEDAAGTGVVLFAPPGGIDCASTRRELPAHGYAASRSMRWGIYGSLRDRWSIPCVPVTEWTLARGWVAQVLRAHELPLAMKSTWALKRLMPDAVRTSVRRTLHRSFRAAG
ncbi:MAG TPA: polysaccharide deacetylase family protein [bacterium]|nr:polysaccharide deacetylase family protein [bacterium]